MEILQKPASGPDVHDGFEELRVNNQRIYRAENTNDWGEESASALGYANLRFGGNYGFDGPETYYRYYGDFYIDTSHARVVLGDRETFNECTHFEVQVPSSWRDDRITVEINQGMFQDGGTAYIYVFDNENKVSTARQIQFTDLEVAPNAPQDLRLVQK